MVFWRNCPSSRPILRGKEKEVEHNNMITLFLQLTQVLMSRIVDILKRSLKKCLEHGPPSKMGDVCINISTAIRTSY